MIRWISGLLIASGVVFLLLAGSQTMVQWVVVALSLLALWEYFSLTLKGVTPVFKFLGLALGGILTASLIFWANNSDRFFILLSVVIVLTIIFHFRGRQGLNERVRDMVFFYFGVMFISVLFAFWALIRGLDQWSFWVFLLLGSTFASDTGAYMVGHRFGRHKLAPLISPGKTVEGLIGGWIFALIAALVVQRIFWPEYPLTLLMIIGTLIATVGPLGDLSESLIKRGVDAKDSGRLIPGHGGFLDRVDALLFNGPVVYFFAQYFS